MLLQHPWLAPLAKPETITEEDEDEVAAATDAEGGEAAGDKGPAEAVEVVFDQEVADWVKGAIEKRKKGTMKRSEKPALHAAPLDAVQSPSHSGTGSTDPMAAAAVEASA
jgi:mitogen-activated protein kinase kinase